MQSHILSDHRESQRCYESPWVVGRCCLGVRLDVREEEVSGCVYGCSDGWSRFCGPSGGFQQRGARAVREPSAGAAAGAAPGGCPALLGAVFSWQQLLCGEEFAAAAARGIRESAQGD